MAEPPKCTKLYRKLQRQNIPELCLDAIFKHIPLEDLLWGTAGLISKCWYNSWVRELATKRQTLFLVQDKDDCLIDLEDFYPYKDQCLSFDLKREDGSPLISMKPMGSLELNVIFFPGGRLNAKFTSKLLQNLPKIKHLVVLAKLGVDNSELEQVIRLLAHYSAHLLKLQLSLSTQYKSPILPETLTRLFESINRLAVLDRLKLNINIPVEHDRPFLSILSRVTTFSYESAFYQSRNRVWLQSSLSRYAGGENSFLRSIGCEGLDMAEISKLDSQIVSKFYWLDVSVFPISHNQMFQLFSHFNSLTCLQLWDYQLPITKLAKCLAQVPSLVYLKLQIPGSIQKERLSQNGEEIRIYQVHSLLELNLLIETESHEEVERLHLAQIFPRLQVIHIIHEIENCRSCSFKRKMATFDRVSKCRRLARETMLAGCHNLHRIIHESEKNKRLLVSVYI